MTRKQNPAIFPQTIESPRFGTLKLEEYPITTKVIHRNYAPAVPVKIPNCRVPIDPKGLTLSIGPPDTGIPDIARFVAALEQRFEKVVNQIDRIVDQALPVVESAIDYFWQIPDERAPTAKQLLDTSEWRQLNLCAGPGTYTLIFYDRGDLIGGHDLLIELTDDLHPTSANFDG